LAATYRLCHRFDPPDPLALRTPGERLDFVVISYVLEMYMTDDRNCDMMAGWLKDDGVRAVVISSRSQTLDAAAMMAARGCAARPLIRRGPHARGILACGAVRQAELPRRPRAARRRGATSGRPSSSRPA
jgi:hypothetical protein